MRQFFNISKKLKIVSQLLLWSNYVELLSMDDINEINYYIKVEEKENSFARKNIGSNSPIV